MRTSSASQPSESQINQFLKDTSPDFHAYQHWLDENKKTPQIVLAEGTLQAIHRHWVDLKYDQPRLEAFLVYLFRQIAGGLQWFQSTLQDVGQLLTALKMVTSGKDLDIKTLCEVVIRLIQSESPPSSQVIANLLQSLERIHFYSDNPCEIPLEVLLRALELVLQQSESEYQQIGIVMLSIGQLVETNIPYYYGYLRIAGTRWIQTIDNLFKSLAGMKNKNDLKYLIYALNGSVLMGRALPDANSDAVFKCIIVQPNYLTDSSTLSYSQRQERLKLARQLYLYALVTNQIEVLPPGMLAFLEKNRPPQPSEGSFEAKVVKELKDKSQVVTQVGMEKGPVLYPFDIFISRQDKENLIKVDVEMKGRKHLTRIQSSKDLFRDIILYYVKAADVILPFFWHEKPTVTEAVSQILTAKPRWDNRERPALYEWISGSTEEKVSKQKKKKKKKKKSQTPLSNTPASSIEQKSEFRRIIASNSIEEKLLFSFTISSDIPRLFLWAEDGNPIAQCYLGIYYHDGIQVERDLTAAMKWFHCAAEQGHVAALSLLASCYAEDKEVRDISQAIRWYTAATEKGNSKARFALGEIFKRQKNFDKAFYWNKLAAESKFPPALYYIGLCYMQALGVNRDWKEAVRFFNEAIIESKAQKDSKTEGAACGDLGFCYMTGGYGVAADSKQAIRYLKLSADLNNSAGLCLLAQCYILRIGVEPNLKLAESLLLPLIDKGDARAQFQLGKFYIENRYGKDKVKRGIELLMLAVDQEFPDAQAILGECYFNGCGVNPNQKEALRLWDLAAKKGDITALSNLGRYYLDGQCVEEDKQRSFYYLKLAVQGNVPKPNMFVDFGRCYQYGYGVGKNLQEALRWYRLAGENGSALCRIAQVMLELGQEEKAFDHFKVAAQKGHAYAQFVMGQYCEEASPPKLTEAVLWYQKSAAQGNKHAENALHKIKNAVLATLLRNTGSPLASSRSTLPDIKSTRSFDQR